MHQIDSKKIDVNGKIFIAGMILHQIILLLILFISAGTLYILRFWIFFVVNLSYTSFEIALLIKKNPQLINGRGNPIDPDTLHWDKYIVRLYMISFYAVIILSALDFGRFNWGTLYNYYMIPGYLFYLTGSAIITWSQYVNKYFERTVRIQTDRDHSVVSIGPYKYIRHPGYLGIIFLVIGIPLLLGSAYGLIASAFCVLVIIVRTGLEDNVLKKELKGYEEYCRRVKYQLCPEIF